MRLISIRKSGSLALAVTLTTLLAPGLAPVHAASPEQTASDPAGSGATMAPAPASGPVIDGFGKVYDVPDATVLGRAAKGFQAVFDVSDSPDDPATLNPRIESVAGYLNMHARAGYELHRIRAVLVLHGAASKDALSDVAYQERHGTANPNSALLAALHKAGVRIYLCGQSAAHSGYAKEDLADPVDLALSAMTALLEYQSQGYGLIEF